MFSFNLPPILAELAPHVGQLVAREPTHVPRFRPVAGEGSTSHAYADGLVTVTDHQLNQLIEEHARALVPATGIFL